MDVRLAWTDCDETGDYVVPNVLSPRDLAFFFPSILVCPQFEDYHQRVRSFTGMDLNGLNYRNGLPERTFIYGYECM